VVYFSSYLPLFPPRYLQLHSSSTSAPPSYVHPSSSLSGTIPIHLLQVDPSFPSRAVPSLHAIKAPTSSASLTHTLCARSAPARRATGALRTLMRHIFATLWRPSYREGAIPSWPSFGERRATPRVHRRDAMRLLILPSAPPSGSSYSLTLLPLIAVKPRFSLANPSDKRCIYCLRPTIPYVPYPPVSFSASPARPYVPSYLRCRLPLSSLDHSIFLLISLRTTHPRNVRSAPHQRLIARKPSSKHEHSLPQCR
jgi:hypothetical protein